MKVFRPFIAGLTLFLLLVMTALTPLPTHAAVEHWQQGVSIVPRWDTDYASDTFRQSVQNIADLGANYVTLVVPIHQANVHSTDIYNGWNTPTDQALIAGINHIHSLGMQVNLKIHLETDDGQWRANINPGDRSAWFTNYGNRVRGYVTIAANHGVEQMTIGAELIHMAADDANSTNTQNWRDLISSIRSLYGGKLTYSANWGGPGWTDEKNRIAFWDALDYIGISAYFPLPTNNKTVAAYKNEWHSINTNDISKLQSRFNKPVLLTEVGYRSMDWAQWAPFNYWDGGAYDPQNQANLYEALLSYWNDYGFMQGVHFWDWSTDPNYGGSGNIDFTPQHKQAQDVLKTWFSTGGSGTSPPPPSGPVSFNANATVSPSAPTPGSNTTLQTTITNTSQSSVSDAVVDIEVYTQSGQKVFQEFFEQQTFSSNETKQYSPTWQAGSAGTYIVKVGVFSSQWSSNYLWVDSAATIQVGSNGTEPPPTSEPGSLNLWWPTDGATLSGTQPLKAMLENRSIDTYTMYWQVDGDQLNEMYTSQEDYPHKEAWVDFSGWNWKGSGPYQLTFIAKDLSGTTITTKQVSISVAH